MEPTPQAPDVDAEIAAFHRAARKRKARVYGVAAAVLIAVGAILLIVAFSAEPRSEVTAGIEQRYELRAIVLGVAVVAAGAFSGYNAYRIGTGQVDDVDV
jgi:hypothetical protein